MSEAEIARVVAGAPYDSLTDFWQRAQVSRPVVERLVLVGAFDSVHGTGAGSGGPGLGHRGRLTRRDLLLHVAELDRWTRTSHSRPRGRSRRAAPPAWTAGELGAQQVRTTTTTPVASQLTLDLGDSPELGEGVGLPEMTVPDQVSAELEILGLDASRHVMEFYAPMLRALGVTRSADLLSVRSNAEILAAGVKVATQTPPIRSGRRVVFLTVDDSTGPVDATFFEDTQGPYAATIFHSWLLLVRGTVRRAGDRGVSVLASGAWELSTLWDAWQRGGIEAVHAALDEADDLARARDAAHQQPEGHRVLVHASGFRQSPWADIRPAGSGVQPPRKLWHSSPGSSGH